MNEDQHVSWMVPKCSILLSNIFLTLSRRAAIDFFIAETESIFVPSSLPWWRSLTLTTSFIDILDQAILLLLPPNNYEAKLPSMSFLRNPPSLDTVIISAMPSSTLGVADPRWQTAPRRCDLQADKVLVEKAMWSIGKSSWIGRNLLGLIFFGGRSPRRSSCSTLGACSGVAFCYKLSMRRRTLRIS